LISQNKFEVLASRVMRYGVKEMIIRRQEMEEVVRYFRYRGIGYHKWECPNIEVEKKRQEEVVVHVALPPEAQQKEKLACSLWRKVQKYSSI